MNNKPKMNEKTLTTLLYVGAAVLVVAVLCVSIFAFASRSRKTNTPTSTPSTSSSTAPTTSSTAPVTTEAPVTTTPTTNKVTGIDKPTSSTPTYTNPVDGTVSKSHDSETLVYSVTMNDYRVHMGVDVEAAVGSPVYAVAGGKITGIYQDYLMGTCMEIEHDGGIVSCYKNLQETLPDGIAEGVTVSAGQLIAGVGETAIIEQCDEAHLHFEMKKNGEYVNPLDYISYGKNTETVDK